jgi:hypothetical protein
MGVIGKDLGVPYGECGHNHSAALFLCMDRGPGRTTLYRRNFPLELDATRFGRRLETQSVTVAAQKMNRCFPNAGPEFLHRRE